MPSLPVVAALVQAGVDVTFHTTPAFRAMVEPTGARVAEYPASFARLSGNSNDLQAHVRRLAEINDTVAPSLASGPHADLVVHDASAAWGRAVAHRWGRPTAVSVTTFVFTRSMLRMIGDTAWMTDADVDTLATTGDLKVVYTSRVFQPAGAFLDDSHLFVGPLLEHRRRDGARVAPEGSRPLAYVSLGTIYNQNVSMLRALAARLSDAGWQVVVSLGSEAATAGGEWPPHVRAFGFIDQLSVLEHARLVVSHGGLQTVTESLAQGVPLIVIPQDVDQHLVGQRAAGLGAAIKLDEKTPGMDTFDAAVGRIAAEGERFAAAAAAIGRSFGDGVPLAAAVQRMIGLAATASRSA
ncbi:MAG: nucleotide disphospho-sugar-binding domain-containing protein [Gemmatimonadota bacterium]